MKDVTYYMKSSSRHNAEKYKIYQVIGDKCILKFISRSDNWSKAAITVAYEKEHTPLEATWNHKHFKFDIVLKNDAFLEML